MEVGDKVKVVKGGHIGKIGIVKSKDHSYRKFGIKKYGLKFNIVEESGDIISMDANDAELVEIKKNVYRSK
ncbi:hypothetical protein ACFLYB_04930 [Chloroflexota bacterium]